MKKFFIFILLLFFSATSFAEETLNIGIVDGLWFSESNFFVGDEVFLNLAFFNNSNFDITGTITFYNNKKDFFIKKIEVSKNDLHHIKIPFSASVGENKLTAQILEVSKIGDSGKKEGVLAENKIVSLGKKSIYIDIDTDKDKLGDMVDEDDDGDGYLDKIEKEEGSDPLNKNHTPKNKNNEEKNSELTTESILNIPANIIREGNDLKEEIRKILEEEIKSVKLSNQNVINDRAVENLSGQKITTDSIKEIESINVKNINEGSDHNKEDIKKENTYYLYFLEFWHSVFSSTFWGWVLLVTIIYILYRILKRILFS